MKISLTQIGKYVLLVSAGLMLFSLMGCKPPFTSTPSPPKMSWQGLEEGQIVYGIVKLSVRIQGNQAREIRFYDNAMNQEGFIGAADPDTGPLYSCDWFTQEVANGEHVIYSVNFSGEEILSQVSLNLRVSNISRADSISPGTLKMTPENDQAPPQLVTAFNNIWQDPVPLEGPINTAGAEDSPFITPDGNSFYFWFNGGEMKDAAEQIKDPMTGVYWAKKADGEWQEPQRLFLQYCDKLGFDGAQTVRGDILWFASIREGNYRDMDMWTAELINGRWIHWSNAGELLNKSYQIGELHVSVEGNEIYFDSSREEGRGGKDIWITRKINGQWQAPQNIGAVNTTGDEGWPFVSEDGKELWFTRLTPGPSIFRSLNVNGSWQSPEMIVSNLAGEPTLDYKGNLYFVHHRWDAQLNRVTEADIYVCYKK